MSVTICHASIDERNKAKGGSAGDQTGKEVCTRAWYKKPWEFLLRFPDASVSRQAVQIALKLAGSNLVGYDQNQRNTLYSKLASFGWDVDRYIASGIKTETDCSAFIYACFCCVVPAMRSTGNAPRTATMKAVYKAWGFKVLTASKYLTTDTNLMVGDILVKAGSHTVLVVSDGSNAVPAFDWSAVFSAEYYASRYPDLRAAGIVLPSQLLNHFINHGMSEQRQACDDFNVTVYRNNYADLRQAFGDDWVAYYRHYCTNGKAEGRKAI